MSMDVLMILLAAAAALTGLVTEAFKKMIGDERVHSPNLLAAIVSIIVAGAVCAWYIVMHDIALSTKVWAQIVALIILSWLCAMCGFDKVRQTIEQLIGRGTPAIEGHTNDEEKTPIIGSATADSSPTEDDLK